MDLHFKRSGEGPALLLLHGLGGYGGLWEPVLEHLESDREVIVPDLPGFGRSQAFGPGTPATAANMATVVVELCERLGLRRPEAAGNSLGAWVALEMAKRGEVASVVGISPAGLWARALGPRRRDVRALGRRLRPFLAPALATRGGRARLLRTFVAQPGRVPPVAARELVRNYLDAEGYDAANEAMRQSPFEHDDRVEVPVTLAWGEEDRLVAPPRPARMPPGARYLTVPGWGHTPTYDDPAGVARLILAGKDGRAAEL